MYSLRFICAQTAYATFEKPLPAPLLRRKFFWQGDIASASLTLCAPGFYELFLNGHRLTKGLLAPYIANPDDLLCYDQYDLKKTGLLRQGENVLGLVLGNGMLNCPGGSVWELEKARYRSAPKVALSLDIEGEKEEALHLEGDEQFLCHPSPILMNDLRAGEWYDARLKIPGWNLPGFDDHTWTPALPAETPRGDCHLVQAEPILKRDEIRPLRIFRGRLGSPAKDHPMVHAIRPEGEEAEKEGWVYDFGINDAGLCRLTVKGRPGQKILLQFAETLDVNGDLDQNFSVFLPEKFAHRDVYICRGEGEESYLPSFTYHGFRYCMVRGITEEQATESLLTFVTMSSALPPAGSFQCSDETLTWLQKATCTSDISNFYYFPTDCPHREKNGWTGDAALSCEQLLLNFHAEKSLREWLRHIRAAQRMDGALPGIVPTAGWGFDWGCGPAWDMVLIELPFELWRFRGDQDTIRENAGAIFRYLHYLSGKRDGQGLLHYGLGDWCHAAHKNTPKAPLEVTDTLTCMEICRKAALLFDVIDEHNEAAYARALYEEIRQAARSYLLDQSTLTVLGGCQTSQAMGLAYNLFESGERQGAFAVLLDLIDQQDGLMDVGVLGARVLFRVLSAFGRTDLAFDMITTPRYPSFGYWKSTGATSLYEGFWPEKDKRDSCNHHFWGDISGWLYENIAGLHLNPYARCPHEALIQPRILDSLQWASASFDSPMGPLLVKWQRTGENVLLKIQVPPVFQGQIMLEKGWQFENGSRGLPLRSGEYLLLPSEKKDRFFEPIA